MLYMNSYYIYINFNYFNYPLNALIEVIAESLKDGEKIQVVGFGSFEVRERAERKGRNPQTGKEMKIAAKKAPVFKAGKALKDAVNG